MGLGIGYVFKSIAMLAVVLLLVNIILKQLNHTMTKQTRVIQVIERTSVSKNASLAVVKMGESYYAMSFADAQSTILKELTEEEVTSVLEKNAETPSALTELNEKLPISVSRFLKKIELVLEKKPKKEQNE